MFQSSIVSVKTIYKMAFILIAFTILAGISRAEGPAARPGFGDSPTPVTIFVFIIDLDETDRVRPLQDVWNPHLLIVNQQRVLKTFPDVVSISPKGEVLYR